MSIRKDCPDSPIAKCNNCSEATYQLNKSFTSHSKKSNKNWDSTFSESDGFSDPDENLNKKRVANRKTQSSKIIATGDRLDLVLLPSWEPIMVS